MAVGIPGGPLHDEADVLLAKVEVPESTFTPRRLTPPCKSPYATCLSALTLRCAPCHEQWGFRGTPSPHSPSQSNVHNLPLCAALLPLPRSSEDGKLLYILDNAVSTYVTDSGTKGVSVRWGLKWDRPWLPCVLCREGGREGEREGAMTLLCSLPVCGPFAKLPTLHFCLAVEAAGAAMHREECQRPDTGKWESSPKGPGGQGVKRGAHHAPSPWVVTP